MAARRLPRPSRRVLTAIGWSLAVVTVAGLAIIAPGFDARRTPVDDGAVWAIQSGENLRYARVNLEIGELDIVKRVDNPSAVVQSGLGAMVLTSNYSRYAQVSAARSADLVEDAPELIDSPSGTQSVQAAGERVVFRTDAGQVYLTTIGAPEDSSPHRIDRDSSGGEGESAPWTVDAFALSADGLVAGWSSGSRTVSVYDLVAGEFRGDRTIDASLAPGADAQITLVAGRWALLDPEAGIVVIEGRENSPSALDVGANAVLQRASLTGESVLVSDENGLYSVPLGGDAATAVIDHAGLGVPAAITELDGVRWAAWLAPGASSGTLWRSDTFEQRELDYAGGDIGDEPQPVLQSTGARMALNDAQSGWVWTVPDGRLLPSSLDWTAGEQDEEQDQDQEVVSAAVDPKPPVVVDDEFGVRAGAAVTLPVLLNDSDPNGDVLTIVPQSLEGLDPAFGVATTVGEDQSIMIQVAPRAKGSAQLTYRAEDGTADGGLLSERAASVTITVVPETQNSPPVWCGVEGCTAERPAPQVGPGSAVEFDWLRGWVDPEGDPMFVSRVDVVEGSAVAAATDAGRILVRHIDPNGGGGRIRLEIGVSDVRGAETVEAFDVPVTEAPAIIAQSFAVVAQAGSPVEIDPSRHMSGGSGPLTVVSAIPSREGRGEVALNPVTGIFTFTAASAGSYLVDWTVSDGVREQLASVRVTLREASDGQLTVAPVVAFVRPQEDATIDVFSAVTNPAGHVLLLSDVIATPSGGSSLYASAVGRDLLRVSGTTATLRPGLLGEVGFTVSDGTGRSSATARGAVSVYLLPVPPAAAPIAVDDAIVVRAGERVDVPVLANDVAVLGNAIAFDPRGIQTEAGLAFTTTRALRLLAPREPGSYTVRYTIYSVGYPSLTDVGTVHVTVVPAGVNAAPAPGTLFGRVVSGGVVTIPFTSLGVDSDGDEVRLDAIVDQPERGAARLTADGRSISYTSVLGDSGEVSFRYRVRDALGLTGEGLVRVGVLAEDEDPSPIAYSDYVQVTVGAESQVVVRPLENDIDPVRTRLSLLGDPVPNVSSAEGFEEEYRTALDRIVSVDDGVITFRAGTELGTFSYFYDVVNEFGDVSRGTIVIRVVRESVASVPIVSDTVLTAETRASFAQGVDVVTGRVSWSGGDVSSLELSLWGEPPGVSVQGSRIRGDLPDRRLVIPFELTGSDFLGQEVVSYGFLVVPGPLDLPPTLRSRLAPTEVKEREQVSIDLADVVVVPSGAVLELDSSSVRSSGQRPSASCAASGPLGIAYVAGENSPWRDYCIVPVRYEGQESWTHLTVPIRVVPGDPQPELRSASLEISPGAELVYELASMTTWQGDPQRDASYTLGGAAGSFEIQQDASTQTLVIRGKDAAVPGTVEVVSVGIDNPQYAGVLPAGLTLRVGPAPSTLPKGGTVTQECSVSRDATQCTIRVVGAAGEVNPLPRTPLVVTSVTNPEACPTVDFAVAGSDSVLARWSQETPGAVCSATFTVRDAQRRESAADRVGTVILDFQGLPAAAASISQTAYGDGTIRLAVSPGAASSSYPALTGFDIVSAGRVVSTCTVQGRCQQIEGLENGTPLDYEAYAVNAQGRALTAPKVSAWSYVAPPAPTNASFAPTAPGPGQRIGWTGGLVDLTVSGISEDTAWLEIRRGGPGGQLIDKVDVLTVNEIVIDRVDVGSNTPVSLTLIPISRFDAPRGDSSTGEGLSLPGVHGVGSPVVESPQLAPGSPNQLQVTPQISLDSTGATVEWTILSSENPGGSFPDCTSASGWSDDPAPRSVAVAANKATTIATCARARFDSTTFGIASAQAKGLYFEAPDAPSMRQGYLVTDPSVDSAERTISARFNGPPAFRGSTPERFELRYFYNGAESSNFPSLEPNLAGAPEIEVRYCHLDLPDEPVGNRCSEAAAVTPRDGSIDRPVSLRYLSEVEDETDSPFGGSTPSYVTWTSAASGGTITYTITVLGVEVDIAIPLSTPPVEEDP